jgi:hypothetical protein
MPGQGTDPPVAHVILPSKRPRLLVIVRTDGTEALDQEAPPFTVLYAVAPDEEVPPTTRQSSALVHVTADSDDASICAFHDERSPANALGSSLTTPSAPPFAPKSTGPSSTPQASRAARSSDGRKPKRVWLVERGIRHPHLYDHALWYFATLSGPL